MNNIFSKVLWRISPRRELGEVLNDVPKAESEQLALSEIWCSNGSKLPSLSEEQGARRIKVLYLMRIAQGYGHLHPLQEALGLPEINIAVFDKFWKIECLNGVDENADEIEQTFPANSFARVTRTGDQSVDTWLTGASSVARVGLPSDRKRAVGQESIISTRENKKDLGILELAE